MNNHTALLQPTLSGLIPVLSIIGISTFIAYVINVPGAAKRMLFGRATDWITTTGEITQTSLSVRKQTGTYRARIDFLIQVDYTYRVGDDSQHPNQQYLGTHHIAVPRLDVARRIAAQYQPGVKIQVNYNAFDTAITRLPINLERLS